MRATSGNVSARDGDRVAITPTGGVLGELTAEAVVVVDRDGALLEGERGPTSELALHLGALERFGAGAVVHTHPPLGTALSLVLDELPCVHYEMVALGGAVRVAPYRTFGTPELALHLGVLERLGAGAVVHTHPPAGTALSLVLDELPCVHYEMVALGGAVRVAPYRTFGTPELAAVVHDALEGRSAALMANHGAITYGGDLAGAVEATHLLEWACTVYWRAAAIGEPRALGADALGAVGEAVAERGYGTTREAD